MPAPGPRIAGGRVGFSLAPYSYAEARALATALDLAEPVAVTLVRRGYRTVEAARAFLEASEAHDPLEFEGMPVAVGRIEAAIEAGTRITVHGDYDVDGVCATAILIGALRELGANCDWHIPDRLGDGYGLTTATVAALAERGTGLLVTVDCGITCADEVAAARAAGLEVIVTDHHRPAERLPECPVLHPEISAYPCRELCAAGVAHKLAAALRGPEAAERELDLVALATVADLVPLRGENRALVRAGLAEARRARRPGLRALIEVSGSSAERLDEGDIAFRLAPRINAAGRLYSADAGVELMLTPDEDRARQIAAELERANRERRAVEDAVLAGAERALRELPVAPSEAPALVLAGEGWHPGVVGIVASRLAERHWRPVVLIALDEDGRGRGSGRGIPGFDLLAALQACEGHLIRYGGHRAAAGLELEAARVAAFREAFARHAASVFDLEDLVRTEAVDAVVGGESLGHDVAEQLARLGPFGHGNPGVRLLVPSARVGDVRPMGKGERHARFSLRCGSRRALGVAFGVNGELDAAATEPRDVSVRLELNEWNGAVEPRVVLGEIYPPDPPSGAGSGRFASISGAAVSPSGSRTGRAIIDTDRAEVFESRGPERAEFWQRLEAELDADLARWPAAGAAATEGEVPALDEAEARELPQREVVDRSGASGIAAVAALASSGEPVVVLCADGFRRSDLVIRAVRPARFGGGSAAVLSARGSIQGGREAVARLKRHGSGVAVADWPLLELWPELACEFAHVVVIDRAPHPHLDRRARAGQGYLHLLAGEGDTELSLRALVEQWPGREALAALYRELRRAAGSRGAVSADDAWAALSGASSRYPRSPEAAARRLRVLAELGVVERSGSSASDGLRVVSSGGKELERSSAFATYRRRREEGERYLTEARQSS